MAKHHVFCVPFPGAGHAVNMMNAAVMMATPTFIVHVLVMSLKNGRQWLKATGQDTNPNVQLEVLADGKWETWKDETPKDLVFMIQSKEFTQSISDEINRFKQAAPTEKSVALVFNGLMHPLFEVGKLHQLKTYLLSPTAGFMAALANSYREGDTPETKVKLKGIGGSSTPIETQVGDFIEIFTPMMKWYRFGVDNADGLIYTNTNSGLDGPDENNPSTTPGYMIGPILPAWFETGLDDPSALQERMKTKASEGDDTIQFMNKQSAKSVVFVALGSHVHLSLDQAKTIITNLRKHKTPWILLFRENTAAMKQALEIDGSIADGVVTPWAPQLDILSHPALKCVISHGGFGTMVEGVYAGQPFITCPVASDQFVDTRVMTHLGICLGCIAENKFLSVMERGELTPIWPDDGGKSLEKLFDRVFGSAEGEKSLEMAREQSRKLRRRMLDAKNSDAKGQLEKLRTDMMSAKSRSFKE